MPSATALHPALTHLDKTDTYVRLLFIDFSSAFNTIIPQQLIHKLVQLGLNTSLCSWLLDFLTGRPQAVRVGSNTSSTITLNTGAPQGCVLSPLLFTLLTHDCTPSHNSNRFIKFADDTTVVGLISNRDETNYRSEVSRLAGWCSDNNLSLNVEKTKEIVVDFRRVHTQHAPLTINGATVERVSSTKFLGVHITEDLSWTNNTAALAKKAQQRLYFLRKLRRARAPAPIMCTFYRGTIESILTSCITVWYGACNASCRKSLQRIVRAAEKIVGVSLPSLQDIYNTRLTRKALSIAGDPTHPTHNFFSLLPSGRRLRSLQARTNRLKDSFIHQAVRKLNSLPSLPPLPSLTPRITELCMYGTCGRIDNKADFDFLTFDFLIISKQANISLAIHQSILMLSADKRIISPLFLSKVSCRSGSVNCGSFCLHAVSESRQRRAWWMQTLSCKDLADVCSRILLETTNTHLQSEKEKSLLCFFLWASLLSPPSSS